MGTYSMSPLEYLLHDAVFILRIFEFTVKGVAQFWYPVLVQ